MKKDYNEILCEAIDTIVSKKIEDLPFDKTFICTIVDDQNKAKGHYIVANQDIKFDAYSENKNYSKDEQVYVLIPNGDFNNPQKMIVSKYIAKEEEEYTPLALPFDTLILSSNNLAEENKNTYSLNINDLTAADQSTEVEVFRWERSNEKNFQDIIYDSFGIKGNFKCLLQNYFITEGEYGLSIILTYEDSTILKYKFSSEDMFGNPFAFVSYVEQQKKIDLPDIDSQLSEIRINLYQNGNFKTYGEKIKQQKITDLYFKNLEFYFSINSGNKVENSFEIKATNNFYNNIEKEKEIGKDIQYFWFRHDQRGKLIPFPVEGYIIDWYYYNEGRWHPYNSIPNNKILLRENKNEEHIKAILKYQNKSYESNDLTFINSDSNINKATTFNIEPGYTLKNYETAPNEKILDVSSGALKINENQTLSGIFFGQIEKDSKKLSGLFGYDEDIQSFCYDNNNIRLGKNNEFLIKDNKCTLNISQNNNSQYFIINNKGETLISDAYLQNIFYKDKDNYKKLNLISIPNQELQKNNTEKIKCVLEDGSDLIINNQLVFVEIPKYELIDKKNINCLGEKI